MEDRFINILNFLSGEGSQLDMWAIRSSPYSISGFKKLIENEYLYGYRLEREQSPAYLLAEEGDQLNGTKDSTHLFFYPPGQQDDVFTVEIKHYFGWLAAAEMNFESIGQQLLGLMGENTESFIGTGAFLATEIQGATMLATVNCMQQFLVSWDDVDIARVLSFQLAVIYKALQNNWDDALSETITLLRRF